MKPVTTVVWCDPDRIDEFAQVKARQQAMWASGDFAVIGTTLQIVGEQLCEAADVRSGERVLDVAAGNGNATLAAAHRFASVTSTDYVPALLARGKARAEAEGLAVTFEVADAEALPYADDSFDAVLSTFGVMFAPNQPRAAREMLRVCRPGGRIGLASWTPGGFVGEMLRTVGRHVAPIPGIASPALWGKPEHLATLFPGVSQLTSAVRYFAFRYASAAHFVDVFRRYYGPVHKAFAALDADRQAALEEDLLVLLRQADTGGSRGLLVAGEYLETVIVK
jgi:SAM-dependent methyltransferase